MKYIQGIGYIDESTYYTNTSQNTAESADFDAVYEAETTIYAVPEGNGTQADTAGTQRVTSSEELNDIFRRASETYGVSENLLKAVAKAESNFNASCVSSAGAIGIMQLMPDTASSLGVQNPYNAEENIMGGAKYLSQLLAKYNGDTATALAAYNAGPGNVDKYGGIPPFQETRDYVNRVLGYAGINTTTGDVIYATSENSTTANTAGSQGTNSASATTIYAVASKDAASPARMNLQ